MEHTATSDINSLCNSLEGPFALELILVVNRASFFFSNSSLCILSQVSMGGHIPAVHIGCTKTTVLTLEKSTSGALMGVAT